MERSLATIAVFVFEKENKAESTLGHLKPETLKHVLSYSNGYNILIRAKKIAILP